MTASRCESEIFKLIHNADFLSFDLPPDFVLICNYTGKEVVE